VGKELGANWAGVEMFDLGANNNGTKRRVHFLKSYYQGCICENPSKKGWKKRRNYILSICAYIVVILAKDPRLTKATTKYADANKWTKIPNIVRQRHIFLNCCAYIIRGDAVTPRKPS
jgi:hypothetical protein